MFVQSLHRLAVLILVSIFGLAQTPEKGDPDPARFQKAIDQFVAWDKKNASPENPVLFAGSSSIRMWQSASAFPGRPIVNRGFGGAHISDMLFYFDQIVKPYQPQVIVFYCGDNDIAAGKSVQQVMDDFEAFQKRCGEDVDIVFLPIKPSTARWDFWPKMRQVNDLILKKSKQQEHLIYADTAAPLMDKTGRPRADLLLSDGLHLNQEGYDQWNIVLRPLLDSLLNSHKDAD